MRYNRRLIVFFIVLAGSVCARAQYEGSAIAKEAFEQGDKARESNRYSEASAAYRKAIALDADFAAAYKQYFLARQLELMQQVSFSTASARDLASRKKRNSDNVSGMDLAGSLIANYRALMKMHPEKAIYPWALGELYNEKDPLLREEYCRKAIQLDPRFAPGYGCLSSVAILRGDSRGAADLQRKMMELEPDNVDAAYTYAVLLKDDPATCRLAIMHIIAAFPGSATSAQALYWFAGEQHIDSAKIEIYELLLNKFPPSTFDSSAVGAERLFDIYDRTDPVKAKRLSHQMLTELPKDKDWIAYTEYADGVAKAEQDLQGNNPTVAVEKLEAIKPPWSLFDMSRVQLLQAQALDRSGKTAAAYAGLRISYAANPMDALHPALIEYGSKIDKSPNAVEADIWADMTAKSVPAIGFSLHNFSDDKLISLDDYKGHVVIVDFWFPNCGPCNQSFPYLQQVLSRYKDKGLVVLAINSVEAQEKFVSTLLKSKGYEFVPLKGNQKWVSETYNVRAYPTTFLIGVDGRVYFHPHIRIDSEVRTVSLEIEALLAHGGH